MSLPSAARDHTYMFVEHRSIALLANAIWLQGLGSVAELLRVCYRSGMCANESVWEHVTDDIPVFGREGYYDLADGELQCVSLGHVWNVGLPSGDRWRFRPAAAESAAPAEAAQRRARSYWGMLHHIRFLSTPLTSSLEQRQRRTLVHSAEHQDRRRLTCMASTFFPPLHQQRHCQDSSVLP